MASVGFVGTYPPTQCGIATFNASLRAAMGPSRSGVVALVDHEGATDFGPEVIAEISPGSPESLERAAALLDRFDVVVLQHEFAIYGGKDGREVLDLVERFRVPTIIVLHTVLRSPSPHQRTIIERLAAASDALVVQTAAARSAFLEAHHVASAPVHVIPHGAPSNFDNGLPQSRRRRLVLLTWGLLGPGKGIEYAIEALATLRDLDLPLRYVVHGHTHPRVAEREGEAYRESLIALAKTLGIADLVEFDDRYTDTASLLALIREADVVLLPYLSHDQVVSGVLVEAIASGKPVIATPFPHAVELLREGSGILVPHRDAGAIAEALRRLLTDPEARARASLVARQQAEPFFWESVGRAYRELAASVSARRRKEGM